ncbi:MAG: calcineurin-like phosphoesterase C-terminal domain-containing protein [Planctomycetes bacterium]|nr:calcineurin-like phosphoesterase C-terminal domain-containing protein [Planctomycetota bacterium]
MTGGAVCGAWWEGAYDGFPEGFVVIDIEGDDFSWRYETYGWKAEPEQETK